MYIAESDSWYLERIRVLIAGILSIVVEVRISPVRQCNSNYYFLSVVKTFHDG